MVFSCFLSTKISSLAYCCCTERGLRFQSEAADIRKEIKVPKQVPVGGKKCCQGPNADG